MESNNLYIMGGECNGQIESFEVFLSHEAATDRLKALYEINTSFGSFDINETKINDWGYTIAHDNGWAQKTIQEVPNPGVQVNLPDGRSLYACNKGDPEFPGIRISLLTEGQKPEDGLCIAWAEYNTARTEYTDDERLRIMSWNALKDEPVVNLSFDTGKMEED